MRRTAAVTVVAMLLMILAVLAVVAQLTRGRIDGSLQDRIAAAQAATTRQPDGSLQVTGARKNDIIDSVWVFDDGGHQVTGPEAGSSVQDTVAQLSAVAVTTRVQRDGRVFLAEPIDVGGEHGVAVAEESLGPSRAPRPRSSSGCRCWGCWWRCCPAP